MIKMTSILYMNVFSAKLYPSNDMKKLAVYTIKTTINAANKIALPVFILI